MFEYWYASRVTPESAALLGRVRDAARTEAQAAAQRLVAIGELFVLRCPRFRGTGGLGHRHLGGGGRAGGRGAAAQRGAGF